MGWQEGVVALFVVLAGLFLWRRLRPQRRRTVAFIPLDQIRRRPKPSEGRSPRERP